MIKDSGIYILVTPTKQNKQEYRVTYLATENNLPDPTQIKQSSEVLNPETVKKYFDESPILVDELSARTDAIALAEDMCLTSAPIYTVYHSTPYEDWGKTVYSLQGF